MENNAYEDMIRTLYYHIKNGKKHLPNFIAPTHFETPSGEKVNIKKEFEKFGLKIED